MMKGMIWNDCNMKKVKNNMIMNLNNKIVINKKIMNKYKMKDINNYLIQRKTITDNKVRGNKKRKKVKV